MSSKGTVKIERYESKLLKSNPLDDPYIRDFPVYIPPSYYASDKRFPVVFLLSGFTGWGMTHLNENFMSENIPQRLDRLIREGKMKEMIVAMPDCITKYGGSQYLNSSATGKYEYYVIKELVPYIDSMYRTIPRAESRAVCGKSSGGYGAIVLAMKHPSIFGLTCSTAGDMAFEYCYMPDFPKSIVGLEKFGKGHKAVRHFIHHEINKSQPKDRNFFDVLNLIGMSSCYSPNPAGLKTKGYGFDLPYDVDTCELDKKVFDEWLLNDPVRMIDKHIDNLKKLNLIFLDAGIYDQFNLHVGARMFCAKLKANHIRHHHEEFPDSHSNVQYRYDRTFEMISSKIVG
jgi:enterochelin esterase family protein